MLCCSAHWFLWPWFGSLVPLERNVTANQYKVLLMDNIYPLREKRCLVPWEESVTANQYEVMISCDETFLSEWAWSLPTWPHPYPKGKRDLWMVDEKENYIKSYAHLHGHWISTQLNYYWRCWSGLVSCGLSSTVPRHFLRCFVHIF